MVRAASKASKNAQGDDGWSKEQEAKLHQAHLIVRATPNFWRDIAKLVPGKTASECFNKFYSAHPTPPVHQPRTPKRECLTSPIKPLGKLLSPCSLIQQKKQKKSGKPGGGKMGIVKSHRAVREILRKQQSADEGYEEDAFAALESADVPSWHKAAASVPSHSPCRSRKRKQSKKMLKEMSAMGAVELQSKLSPTVQQSPEVLKHATNERKHDKYLDLLIRRHKLPKAERRNPKNNDSNDFAHRLKTRLGSTKDLLAVKTAVIASARDVLEQASVKQTLCEDEFIADQEPDMLTNYESEDEDLEKYIS